MKKLRIGLTATAVILAGGLSAFSILPVNKDSNTTYVYSSTDQSIAARETASNYIIGTTTCPLGNNECSVTLDQNFGTNPDFTNVTFDPSTGMPNGGSDFVSNQQKH
jgi:hypothetical protein